jgi:hypothetical protein
MWELSVSKVCKRGPLGYDQLSRCSNGVLLVERDCKRAVKIAFLRISQPNLVRTPETTMIAELSDLLALDFGRLLTSTYGGLVQLSRIRLEDRRTLTCFGALYVVFQAGYLLSLRPV